MADVFSPFIVTLTPFPVILRETMPDSDQRTSRAQPQVFPHTRWSVVLAATQQPSAEAEAALETICRAYWYPLYAFVRRQGSNPHNAQDSTQKFFAWLLESGRTGAYFYFTLLV